MTKGQEQFLIDWVNVMLKHPGKTIKISKDGIEALETDAPPDLIIEGSVMKTKGKTDETVQYSNNNKKEF